MFSLKIVAGNLQVRFTKMGVDGMNVMVKAGDETAFTFNQGGFAQSDYFKAPIQSRVMHLVTVQLRPLKEATPLDNPVI
jgi:hypothetical protein